VKYDPIVAAENVQQLARMLEKTGANVTLHIEPAGHALTRGDISVAQDWLENLDSSE
jgi:predicted esterase